jgi:hypothetical protein
MKTSDKTGLKGRELAARLIGIRTPIGGIDWEPPAGERKRAKRVLRYLAEQRALWDPYDVVNCRRRCSRSARRSRTWRCLSRIRAAIRRVPARVKHLTANDIVNHFLRPQELHELEKKRIEAIEE